MRAANNLLTVVQALATSASARTSSLRLLGDGGWVIANQVFSALGLLVGTRILTELAPPTEFGKATLLIGLGSLATNTLCLPWIRAAYRFFPEQDSPTEARTLRRYIANKVCRACWTICGAFLLLGIAASWWGTVSIEECIAVSVLMFSESFVRLETCLLAIQRRQRDVAFWNVSDAWGRIGIATLACLVWGGKCESILVGYAFATTVVLAVGSWLAHVQVPLDARASAHDHELSNEKRLEIARFSQPLVPQALVGWGTATADRYIIWWGTGAGPVAIYATIYGLVARIFGLLATPLELTLRPAYFASVAARNLPAQKRLLQLWLGSLLAMAVALTLTLQLFGDWLVGLLFAAEYRSGKDLLLPLSVAFFLMTIGAFTNEINVAHKQTRAVLCGDVVAAVAGLSAAVPLVLNFGILGAAYATCVGYFAQIAVAGWLARRAIRDSQAVGN